MKPVSVFFEDEVREAIAYAATDGVAVHLHWIVFDHAPQCFRRDVKAGYPIAHVFCQNEETLRTLARRLGVRVVFVHRSATDRQHIDMCGKPLRKLLAEIGHSIEWYKA